MARDRKSENCFAHFHLLLDSWCWGLLLVLVDVFVDLATLLLY